MHTDLVVGKSSNLFLAKKTVLLMKKTLQLAAMWQDTTACQQIDKQMLVSFEKHQH